MELIQLQWKRNSKGSLELWVNEEGSWIKYNKPCKYYKADEVLSTNSGFATYQNYYNLDKKGVIKIQLLPV